MTDEDESVPGVQLPRRPPRPGEGLIGEARTRLFGGRAAAGSGDGGVRWPAVEDRERSAAFARAAVARPSTTEAEASVESGRTVVDGTATGPRDADPAGGDGDDAVVPPPDRRGDDVDRAHRRILGAAVLAAVLALGLVVGLVVGRSSVTPAAVAPPSPPVPAGATLIGEVVAVPDGQTVTVQVGGAFVDVAILGLDTPDPAGPGRAAECGAGSATAYASDTLTGQLVTLVPDPSVGEFDARGRRLAYVVLRSQASYTDVALNEGIGRRSTTPTAWYDAVFVREEEAARAAGAGIWGAPCRAVL